MATPIKVISIGNSNGVILPKETLARLNVQKGDTLYLSETPQGIRLVAYDEEFARQMDVALEVPDLDGALDWARRMPVRDGQTVEVRAAMTGMAWQRVLG